VGEGVGEGMEELASAAAAAAPVGKYDTSSRVLA